MGIYDIHPRSLSHAQITQTKKPHPPLPLVVVKERERQTAKHKTHAMALRSYIQIGGALTAIHHTGSRVSEPQKKQHQIWPHIPRISLYPRVSL